MFSFIKRIFKCDHDFRFTEIDAEAVRSDLHKVTETKECNKCKKIETKSYFQDLNINRRLDERINEKC